MKNSIKVQQNHKNTLAILIAGIAMVFASALTSCGPRNGQANIEVIQNMMESPAIKAQEGEDFFSDHSGMRLPPENTVPVGFAPYKFKGDVLGAEKSLQNPLAGNFSPEVIKIGRKMFETNCMVCHGMKGHGDGPVAEKMPNKPPSLVSDKIKGWADGQIYQVISMGQGTMGSYASHIPQKYRWQVVNYIRHLQKTDKN
jgi:mono/diheme cytochrome c family protein